MYNMELQREAIIEIVGTQYEGRAANHKPQFLNQRLILKHLSENPHDQNAVILLTEDGKELGFLPKGYASLYAPAIDSGRYTFSVEVVMAESSPERPILIVKIISDFEGHSEEETESDIIGFVQNIVNGYTQKKEDYLTFIDSEKVDVEELLSALNSLRIIQKLLLCSNDIIERHSIKPNSDKFKPLTKESLTQYLGELKTDVADILKKIQKSYNESIDIEDEEEYNRIHSDIRERKKRFRQYDELLSSLQNTAASYVNITSIPSSHIDETTPTVAEPEVENIATDGKRLSEQAFIDWLVSVDGMNDQTAGQHISNIRQIEKLNQNLFGIRQNILGASSADDAKSIIEKLIQRKEYIDANARRRNSFNLSLNKFAKFADINIPGLKSISEKKHYQPHDSSRPYVIKTVDFENPYDCTYYKPCSFTLNGFKYSANSWRELYSEFLILLYTDNDYSEILKGLIGKSLYGHHIDFADKTISDKLRSSIKVADDFFAEGNFSAIDIIKHIKHIMALCSIEDKQMIIEYSTQEINNDVVSQNVDSNEPDSSVTEEEKTAEDNFCHTITEASIPAAAVFSPDTEKPFVLKDALIEILLADDAPEIAKYRVYNGGISSKDLRDLIKKYYGKNVGMFELSGLLMLDKTFRSVGKGCYVVNEDALQYEKPVADDTAETVPDRQIEADSQPEQSKYSNVIEDEVEKYAYIPDNDDDNEANVELSYKSEDDTLLPDDTDTRNIDLSLNGNVFRAYDYSDALNKVCEFSINCKPFKMAHIAEQAVQIHGSRVFCRKPTPIDGYNRLSNGLQVIAITKLSELKAITAYIQKYCQINNDMIVIY